MLDFWVTKCIHVCTTKIYYISVFMAQRTGAPKNAIIVVLISMLNKKIVTFCDKMCDSFSNSSDHVLFRQQTLQCYSRYVHWNYNITNDNVNGLVFEIVGISKKKRYTNCGKFWHWSNCSNSIYKSNFEIWTLIQILSYFYHEFF